MKMTFENKANARNKKENLFNFLGRYKSIIQQDSNYIRRTLANQIDTFFTILFETTKRSS